MDILNNQQLGEVYRYILDYKENGFQKYAYEAIGLDTLKNALPPKGINPRVVCMDEGTSDSSDYIVGIPGSGILTKSEDSLAEHLKDLGVKVITSHDSCGAAGIAAKRCKKHEDEPDMLGKEWVEDFAKNFGFATEHISGSQMARPLSHHIARTVYICSDSVPVISLRKGNLPSGFVLSPVIGDDEVCEGLNIAVSISAGEHGPGKESFTKEKPLIVVIVGVNEEEVDAQMKKVESWLAVMDLHGISRDCITVQRLVIPL